MNESSVLAVQRFEPNLGSSSGTKLINHKENNLIKSTETFHNLVLPNSTCMKVAVRGF